METSPPETPTTDMGKDLQKVTLVIYMVFTCLGIIGYRYQESRVELTEIHNKANTQKLEELNAEIVKLKLKLSPKK